MSILLTEFCWELLSRIFRFVGDYKSLGSLHQTSTACQDLVNHFLLESVGADSNVYFPKLPRKNVFSALRIFLINLDRFKHASFLSQCCAYSYNYYFSDLNFTFSHKLWKFVESPRRGIIFGVLQSEPNTLRLCEITSVNRIFILNEHMPGTNLRPLYSILTPSPIRDIVSVHIPGSAPDLRRICLTFEDGSILSDSALRRLGLLDADRFLEKYDIKTFAPQLVIDKQKAFSCIRHLSFNDLQVLLTSERKVLIRLGNSKVKFDANVVDLSRQGRYYVINPIKKVPVLQIYGEATDSKNCQLDYGNEATRKQNQSNYGKNLNVFVLLTIFGDVEIFVWFSGKKISATTIELPSPVVNVEMLRCGENEIVAHFFTMDGHVYLTKFDGMFFQQHFTMSKMLDHRHIVSCIKTKDDLYLTTTGEKVVGHFSPFPIKSYP
jgi:hypothetical protein